MVAGSSPVGLALSQGRKLLNCKSLRPISCAACSICCTKPGAILAISQISTPRQLELRRDIAALGSAAERRDDVDEVSLERFLSLEAAVSRQGKISLLHWADQDASVCAAFSGHGLIAAVCDIRRAILPARGGRHRSCAPTRRNRHRARSDAGRGCSAQARAWRARYALDE